MVHEGVRNYISKLTNEQLLEYLIVGTRDYRIEAVEFAQEEFQRRNLNSEKSQALINSVHARKDEMEAAARIKAEQPLGPPGRILGLAIGFLNVFAMPLLSIAWVYERHGETRKSREMYRWCMAGFISEISTPVLFAVGCNFMRPLFSIIVALIAVVTGVVLFLKFASRSRHTHSGRFEVIIPNQPSANKRGID